jgi:hypothetical protein
VPAPAATAAAAAETSIHTAASRRFAWCEPVTDPRKRDREQREAGDRRPDREPFRPRAHACQRGEDRQPPGRACLHE